MNHAVIDGFLQELRALSRQYVDVRYAFVARPLLPAVEDASSFSEQDVIYKTIDEISKDYWGREGERFAYRWLAAKVRLPFLARSATQEDWDVCEHFMSGGEVPASSSPEDRERWKSLDWTGYILGQSNVRRAFLDLASRIELNLAAVFPGRIRAGRGGQSLMWAMRGWLGGILAQRLGGRHFIEDRRNPPYLELFLPNPFELLAVTLEAIEASQSREPSATVAAQQLPDPVTWAITLLADPSVGPNKSEISRRIGVHRNSMTGKKWEPFNSRLDKLRKSGRLDG